MWHMLHRPWEVSMRLKVAGIAKIREGGDMRLPEAVLAELGWK
jgi:hypothetical protein